MIEDRSKTCITCIRYKKRTGIISFIQKENKPYCTRLVENDDYLVVGNKLVPSNDLCENERRWDSKCGSPGRYWQPIN